MLGLTTASQAKSTEKLSSGYKINRAGKKIPARQIGKTGAHMDRTGLRMFIGMFCESCVIKRIPAVFLKLF
jgi:hypothetical protein